ncbi:MAG: anaerobic ribonucleoside-triphosphate reductase activating protein [Patescibacteria group bacterium]|nr:anaerobic ribonucleoside-triphosphate reductase activating protein [Patescibacteria group bacterium]MDD5715614.1 anaerobic ribonucleoside-triphosphate reductase activating protein [Patescibacteria group bacterium]
MRIGGFQKTSLIDYPGAVSSIIFTTGCNFRCGYCHNPELVKPNYFPSDIPAGEVLDFLSRRNGKIDAVTVTGGEPTLHPDLPTFLHSLKQLKLLIKLDTNGTNPHMIQELFHKGLVDYCAMDIKAPLERYPEITRMPVDTVAINNSVTLIMHSGIPYEFRTTVVKSQLRKNDFQKIGELIRGAQQYYLQKFIPTKANDPAILSESTYSDEEFAGLRRMLLEYVQKCEIR